MKNTIPALLVDGYKIDHRRQYGDNTQLIEDWQENFFSKDIEEIVTRYNRRINNYLGSNQVGDQHIRDLHALGYLPLEIWSLPEGSNVNLRVPMFVVWNTDARFFWLTNLIETILSTTIWLPCTSATTALMYRKILNGWAEKTNPEMIDFVPWSGHDFSFRGHSSYESATTSAAGHLLSFCGTDTVPAIDYLEEFYGADSDKELVGASVPATEHSVQSAGAGSYIDSIPDEIDEAYEYYSYVKALVG